MVRSSQLEPSFITSTEALLKKNGFRSTASHTSLLRQGRESLLRQLS